MNPKMISRRRFLRMAGLGIGAGTLACCSGLGVIALVEDRAEGTMLTFGAPELELGEDRMQKKMLVTYATAHGSTGGVAEMIGKTLAEGGPAVDVLPVQSVTSLDEYGAVVLGSAIQGGKWLPEAVEFLRTNQAWLGRVPVAFFLVGLLVNRKDEGTRKLVDGFLAAERALVEPVAEGRFVGAMLPKNRSGVERFGIRFFTAYCGLGWRGGDFRDPAAIRAWTEELRPLLIA